MVDVVAKQILALDDPDTRSCIQARYLLDASPLHCVAPIWDRPDRHLD